MTPSLRIPTYTKWCEVMYMLYRKGYTLSDMSIVEAVSLMPLTTSEYAPTFYRDLYLILFDSGFSYTRSIIFYSQSVPVNSVQHLISFARARGLIK